MEGGEGVTRGGSSAQRFLLTAAVGVAVEQVSVGITGTLCSCLHLPVASRATTHTQVLFTQ